MSEMTPGPWEVIPGDTIRRPRLIRASGFTIAECFWNEHMEGEPEANARLIAAAPELLAALKRALSVLQSECGHSASMIWFAELEAQALAAIAKAEGRS